MQPTSILLLSAVPSVAKEWTAPVVTVEDLNEFEAALATTPFELILADGPGSAAIAARLAPETPCYVRSDSDSNAMESAERRFREMADSAPVPMWIANAEKRWVFCNRPWVEFTALSRMESEGAGWASLVHPDDLARVLQTYGEAFERRQTLTMEHRLLHCDGAFRWMRMQGTPRFDEAGEFQGMTGFYVDITEMKQTEERLRHAAKLESLGVLACGIAHDFNNLLTGILSNASLALYDVTPGSPAAPLMSDIVRAGETAAHLTRQVLDYAGKSRFVLEQVDLSEEVREILSLVAASVPKTVVLDLDLAPNLPLVEADGSQIQQLVMNLVINGAEAMALLPVGHVSVSTSVLVLDEAEGRSMVPGFEVAPGRYVLLRVHDTGQGMDVSTKTRIFDPFFTTKFSGRGLGLAAVSGIVRGHRGGMALESEPGSGTEFRIYFPVAAHEIEVGLEAAVAAVGRGHRPAAGMGTVLVVDDESIALHAGRLALQRFGYTVLTARNGQEAVDLLHALAQEIDLVFLDMSMPVMAGDIAFREMTRIRPGLRVIATSGYSEADARDRFGPGIHGFIQKPYRAGDLANLVHSVMGLHAGHLSDPD